MSIIEITSLLIVLVPYLAVHAIIVGLLLKLRRGLPTEHRSISRGLLVATALPFAGPLVSSIAFSRLARCAQAATANFSALRSDCGYAAGLAYGVIYFIAAWSRLPSLGALSLALLVIYFWQAFAALRALRRPQLQIS